MVLNLINRPRNGETPPTVEPTYDEQLAAANARLAELQAEVAAVQGEQETEAQDEPDLAEQLRRVEAAIEAAAQEASGAALRGDSAIATAATERHARLLRQRLELRAQKATEDQAALAIQMRQSVDVLYAETVKQLDVVRDEYEAGQAALRELIPDVERNLDRVGVAAERASRLSNDYYLTSESMRVRAQQAGIELHVPQPPKANLAPPSLDWNLLGLVWRKIRALGLANIH